MKHLLAKMQSGRKRVAFDWQPNRYYPDKLFHAPMENGHTLTVHPAAIPGYAYNINDAAGNEVASSPIQGKQPDDIDSRKWHFHPTPQDAMKAAEEHYQQLFPIGTNTGGHDSGVDYSDLNSFKDHL